MNPVWAGLQENYEKAERHSVKGRPEMKGFCRCLKAEKQNDHPLLDLGIWRSYSRSRKRQMRKTWDPSSSEPFTCVPGTRLTIHLLPSVMITGGSTDGIPFAPRRQRVLSGSFSPSGPLLGVRICSPSFLVQSIKSNFVIFFKKNKP